MAGSQQNFHYQAQNIHIFKIGSLADLTEHKMINPDQPKLLDC
jgi:hypothetical protein